MSADPAWHAMDFAAAILAADIEGQHRAVDELLATPRESLHALGTILLAVAAPDAHERIRHMLAMTSLKAVTGEPGR